jgi:Flp pilus assembly protein TadD
MTAANWAASSTLGRRRWIVAAGAALLLAGVAVAGWWWFRPSAVTPPPVPSGIVDAEVKQAIQDARQAVVDSPRSPSAWGRLGWMLLVNQFSREADFCFSQAAALEAADPRWPYARGRLALIYDPDNAVAWLRLAVEAADSRPKYRFATRMRLAEALLERGQLDEAESIFREEDRRQPKQPRVALGLGMSAVMRGNYAEAIPYLTAARESPWARKRATAELAILARAQGDQAAAAAYDQAVLGLLDDPSWPDPVDSELYQVRVGWSTRRDEAASLENEKRFMEAAEIYLKQIAEQPTAKAYIGAGTNLAQAGNYQRALPLLQKAALLEPDSAKAHAALAAALFGRAEKAWHTSPNSAEARQWFDEVVGNARRATELRPDLAVAYLHWGQSLTYLGKPDEALGPLRKGVACQPANVELQRSLGDALLEAGQYKEAATYLENARLLAPNDPRTARALQRLSQIKRN